MTLLTPEQIDFIAKSAVDSYLSNLSQDAKLYAVSDRQAYFRDYIKYFEEAKKEIKSYEKERESRYEESFEPFGEVNTNNFIK